MKLSVELQDGHRNHREQPPPLLLRAKIPITIINLPFLSHFCTTTAHPSDLSLSLSTNFASGPSLRLSYATSGAGVSTPPFSLTLKSGTGLFGSPTKSPLVISANFSFNPSNPNNPSPTFSLLVKPQFGSFSLRKSVLSHGETGAGSEQNGNSRRDSNSFGFVAVESPATENGKFSVEKNDGASIVKGIQLAAKTEMPLANGVAVNCRWWVNFAEDQMPDLRINKIGIRRIYDVEKSDEKKKGKEKPGELEMLKGMCFWMKRELDVLTKVNREMKGELEELRSGHSARLGGSCGGEFREGGVHKKAKPCVEVPSSGFDQWRSKRKGGGEETGNLNGKKDEKTGGTVATDVENELQRAIKAATDRQ